ncbi:zinc finger 862-like [Paramuricea clavata]|uniref:Zinc finger 862-like n=1 Tax=Paramuricea clavata TaxID=317549 RepID=A0A6S7FR96_PARCT|nr:zinc finger 862-like [Paramuricea clavata]
MCDKRRSTLFSFGNVKKVKANETSEPEENVTQDETEEQSPNAISQSLSSQIPLQKEPRVIHANPAAQPVKTIKSNPVPKDEVKSLLNSSFRSKESLHSFYCCADKNCTNISKEETVRIKAKDKFQHAWIFDGKLTYCDKTGYHWLVYDDVESMTPRTLRIRPKSSTWMPRFNRREQVGEDVYYNAFLSLHWTAKQELPNCKFTRLLQLLEKLNLPDIELFQHRSAGSVREMFLLLGQTIKEKILERVTQANCFSMLCDEVSDMSNKQQLVSFIQFVDRDSGKPEIDFLAVDDVLEDFNSANAEAIKSMIKKQFEAGYSQPVGVMTGKRNGVAALLRRESKLLLNVHCICHCLALACGDANDHVQYIQTVEKILVQLWSFFKNSAKKSASYAKATIEAKSISVSNAGKKVLVKKFKKACRTRWLSTERAINGLFQDFVPLTQTLRAYKEENDCTAIETTESSGKHQVSFHRVSSP